MPALPVGREPYNKIISGITYLSELTLPFLRANVKYGRKGWVNSHNNLLTLSCSCLPAGKAGI
jgi:hypothetical protein